MATALSLAMQISANTAQLAASINDVNQKLDSMGDAGKKASRDLGTLKNIELGRLAGAGIAAAANALTDLTRSLVDYGRSVAETTDASNKLARSIGVTYAELSGLQLAAELSGVKTEQLGVALGKFQDRLGRAQAGNAEAARGFDLLGLSVSDLAGLNAAEQMQQVANAISAIPNPAERAAAAVAIFGEEGLRLLPFFENGGDFLEEMATQAQRLGLALNDLQAENVEAMNDALTLAQRAVTGVVTQIVADLAPGIQSAADAFTAFVGETGGVGIGQAFVDGLLNVADVFARVFDLIVENLTVLATSFGLFSESANTASGTLATAADALTAVSLTIQRIFNAFQNIGSFLADLMGRVLTALGDIVSYIPGTGEAGANLSQFGRDLSQSAADQVEARNKAFEDAYNRFLSGEAPNGSAAQQAVAGIRSAIEEARSPLTQLERQVDAARDKIAALEETTGLPAEKLRAAFAAYEQAAAVAAQDGEVTAQEAEAIASAQEEVNRLLAEERGLREASAQAQKEQAAAAVLAAKEAEKEAQLQDRILSRLQDQANAVVDKAVQYGQAGIELGAAYQAELRRIADQVEAGILNETGAQQQQAIAQQRFNEGVKQLEDQRRLADQIAERQLQLDRNRIEELATLSGERLQANDLRTSEGASQFLDLATGREDPAVAEYKKQLRELQGMRQDLRDLGGVVDIVGAN